MAKKATKYLKVDPWKIIEKDFHLERNQVSESIFSISNEYMGVRGYAEEGISCSSLQGSYFNGIYEYAKKINETAYKGIVKRSHFMLNSVNWLKTCIKSNGEVLDTAKSKISDYKRELNLKSGLLTREFTWHINTTKVMLVFERFLSMIDCEKGFQRIRLISDKDINIDITLSLDFGVLHWGKDCFWDIEKNIIDDDYIIMQGITKTTRQRVVSGMKITLKNEIEKSSYINSLESGYNISLRLKKDKEEEITRYISNYVDKSGNKDNDTLMEKCKKNVIEQSKQGYENAFDLNCAYWKEFWDSADIEIEGDIENQQGIRFRIFQLQQTYHGHNPKNNIGAKGLTGEAYSGHAFWDTETYCLPYYLFNNLEAAKDLLLYRYYTLENAKKRAKELDCKGACYPIATLNGDEACDLWQHASLQLQPSTAVMYGISHYIRLSGDEDFLADYGLEMLIEISRFLLSRGQWNASKEYFGYYCVMGPDEFQMMVNHNTYTNFLAKKTFEYTLDSIRKISFKYPEKFNKVIQKLNFEKYEAEEFLRASNKMLIIFDENCLLFEQHQGFFDLPHLDVNEIPQTDFPLYHNWSYDRIYRNDMIKQPDVLMFMFLYNQEFSFAIKKANYDYYEPRCIHESSLSPSVHSIFAAELGYKDEAIKFFGFATRMDLDDYNRNTSEGLHTTSIAAAWMNIVYGFGGLRSDGILLSLSPTIPHIWKKYSFKINYKGETIKVIVDKFKVTILKTTDKPINIFLFNKQVTLTKSYSEEFIKNVYN